MASPLPALISILPILDLDTFDVAGKARSVGYVIQSSAAGCMIVQADDSKEDAFGY